MKKKLNQNAVFLKLLNARGMSLLEVMIGSSLVFAIGYGGLTLTKKFSQAEKTIIRSSDSERITYGARELFSNLDICAANLNVAGKLTTFSKELNSVGIYKNGKLQSTYIAVDSKVIGNEMSIGKLGLSSVKLIVKSEQGDTFPPDVEFNPPPECGKLQPNSMAKDVCLMQRTELASLKAKYEETKTGLYNGKAEISLEFVKCNDGTIKCSLGNVIKSDKRFVIDIQANRTPTDLSKLVCLSPDSEMLVEANYNFCKSVNGEFIGDKCFSHLYNPCGGESGSGYDTCASSWKEKDIEPTGFAKVNTIFCDIGSRVYAKTNKFLTDYCQYKGLALGTGDLTETQNNKIALKGCSLPMGETDDDKTYSYPLNTLMQFFEKTKSSTCNPKKKDDGSYELVGYPTENAENCCEGEMVYYSCNWDNDKQVFTWEKVSKLDRLKELIKTYNEEIVKTNLANPPPASQVEEIPEWDEKEVYPAILEQRDPNELYLRGKDESGKEITIGSAVYEPLEDSVDKKLITQAQIELVKSTYKKNYCTSTKDITKDDVEKINPSVEK